MHEDSADLTVATFNSVDKIPDEILDAVIAALYEPCWRAGVTDIIDVERSDTKTMTSAWKACSLVSKRWNNITVPHLFRSIEIYDHFARSTDVSHHLRFYEQSPQIAAYVRVLDVLHAEIQINVLEGLLRALPTLRQLCIKRITMENDLGATQPNPPARSYAIERLVYQEGTFTLLAQCTIFASLLLLFKEIHELVIISDLPCLMYDEVSAAERMDLVEAFAARVGTRCRTRIDRLIMHGQDKYENLMPLYLVKVGIVGALQHLTISLHSSSAWQSLSNLVLAASTNITGLSVDINRFVNSGLRSCDLSEPSTMEHAISSCKFLQEIKITITLPYTTRNLSHVAMHPTEDRSSLPYTSHEDGWAALLYILNLPVAGLLRRVSIGLRGVVTDPHSLRWDLLREWCARASRLEEISVDFEQAFDQRPCLAYEMRDFKHIFTPKFITPHHFRGVVLSGHVIDAENQRRKLRYIRYKCGHAGSCRYAQTT